MRKAQFAMEYLLVVGFSLVLVVPIIALLYNEYDQNRNSVHIEHLTELSRELVFQAEKTYHQGVPSRTRFEAYIPPGVQSLNITEHTNNGVKSYTLEFFIKDSEVSVYAASRVPLLPKNFAEPFAGPHVFIIDAVREDNEIKINISDKDLLANE